MGHVAFVHCTVSIECESPDSDFKRTYISQLSLLNISPTLLSTIGFF